MSNDSETNAVAKPGTDQETSFDSKNDDNGPQTELSDSNGPAQECQEVDVKGIPKFSDLSIKDTTPRAKVANEDDKKKRTRGSDALLPITENYIATHTYDEVSGTEESDQDEDSKSQLTTQDERLVIPRSNDSVGGQDEEASFNDSDNFMEYNYSHVDTDPIEPSGSLTAKSSTDPDLDHLRQSLHNSLRSKSSSSSLSSTVSFSGKLSRTESLRSNMSSKMSPAAAKLRSNQVAAALSQSSQKKRSSSGLTGFSSNLTSSASSLGTGLSSVLKNNLGNFNNLNMNTISGLGGRYFRLGHSGSKNKDGAANDTGSATFGDGNTDSQNDNVDNTPSQTKKKSRASIAFPFSFSTDPETPASGLRTVSSAGRLQTLATSPTGKTPTLITSHANAASPTTAVSFDTGFGSDIAGFDEMMMMSGGTPMMDYQNDDNAAEEADEEDEEEARMRERLSPSILSNSSLQNFESSPQLPPVTTSPSITAAITDTQLSSPIDRPRSATSPVPTLAMEHGSDVATLLSEVLDSDLEVAQVPLATDGTHQQVLPSDSTNLEQIQSVGTHTDAGLDYPILSDSDESRETDSEDDYDFDIHAAQQHGQQNERNESLDSEDSEDSDTRAAREEKELAQFLARKKQYFVLSTAGKPIYSMYGSDGLITGYMGVFQAIVSYFEDETQEQQATTPLANKNKGQVASQREGLRFLRAGNTIFVFALEDPLILIAVDKLGQTESQLRAQLDLLYAQILSTLTKSQLSKVFRGRTNFDLRPMLAGTEIFLNALTSEMSFGSPGILLGALECLRLRKSVRAKMHTVLSERRTKSLLYGMLVADSRLVAVIRPRRHSLHPPDLHLVFSMIFNTHSFSKGSGEHWVPICLPKFNSTGFLYAYIHFIAPPQVALVLISADKNAFFELQTAKENIVSDLETHNLISPILNSLKRGRYRTIEILGTPHLSTNLAVAVAETSGGTITGVGRGRVSVSAPLAVQQQPSSIPASLLLAPFTIRHFLYKSKQNVQYVMPSFDPHYVDARARHKLMVLYHQLHGAIHATGTGVAGSGGVSGLRVYHVACGKQGVKGSALAWVTPAFELYCVTGSAHEGVQVDSETKKQTKAAASLVAANVNNKDAMLKAVKAIVSWIKSHEERLFIFGGAVF